MFYVLWKASATVSDFRSIHDHFTFLSPVSAVTDTDIEYRGISKYRYRYRSRYSKYRKIPNTEEKIPKKTINRYFNFVITAFLVIRVYARSWLPDWFISSSTIRQFSNFTTFDNPYRNIPAPNWLKFLFRPFVVTRFHVFLSTWLFLC